MKTIVSARHPFELFLLALTLASTAPILAGRTPHPGSTAAFLGPGLVHVWAGFLAVGAAVALVGVVLPDRATGLVVEQVGLVSVAVGCLIYVSGVAVIVGLSAAMPAAIVGGYGVSCLVRWRQIQRYLRDVRRVRQAQAGQ